jgi:hypothetical protein
MFIARWQIEARFGYKQAALDSMKKWIKEVGSKVGWKADKVRVITGSIGANESTIETEIVIKELRELDQGALADIQGSELADGSFFRSGNIRSSI